MKPSDRIDPVDIQEALHELGELTELDKISTIEESSRGNDLDRQLILVHLINDQSSIVREKALDALWEIGGPLPRLVSQALIGDSDTTVRNNAVMALGELGDTSDCNRLIPLLKDSEWVVRASVASSLGSLGCIECREVLHEVLKGDPDPIVRRYAAVALADMGDESSVPFLVDALSTESDRKATLGLHKALYILGQHQYLEELLSYLRDVDPWLAQPVLSGLGRDIYPNDKQLAVDLLNRMLSNESDVTGIRQINQAIECLS